MRRNILKYKLLVIAIVVLSIFISCKQNNYHSIFNANIQQGLLDYYSRKDKADSLDFLYVDLNKSMQEETNITSNSLELYLLKANILSLRGETNKAISLLDSVINTSKIKQNSYLLMRVYGFLSKTVIEQQNDYTKALECLKKCIEILDKSRNVKEMSYYCYMVAELYESLNKYEDALLSINEAQNIINSIEDEQRYKILTQLALKKKARDIYYKQKKYNYAIAEAKDVIDYVSEFNLDTESYYIESILSESNLVIASSYRNVDEQDSAFKYYNIVFYDYSDYLSNSYSFTFNAQLIDYYLSIGDFDSAMHAIATTRQNCNIRPCVIAYNNLELINYEAELHYLEGNYEEALALQNIIISNSAFIENTYNTNKTIVLHFVNQYNKRVVGFKSDVRYLYLLRFILTILISAMIFLVANTIIIFIYIYKSGLRQRYIRDKLIERDEVAFKLSWLKHQLLLCNKATQNDLDYKSLFEHIDHFLNETMLFTNSKLRRDDIANKLHTNRQYIIEAVKKSTNMTFAEYINNKRILYAKELLQYYAHKSIKEVAFESGFGSEKTFRIHFKENTGMNPGEYKQSLES